MRLQSAHQSRKLIRPEKCFERSEHFLDIIVRRRLTVSGHVVPKEIGLSTRTFGQSSVYFCNKRQASHRLDYMLSVDVRQKVLDQYC